MAACTYAAVTGLGIVCALGTGTEQVRARLFAGEYARTRTPASVLSPEALDFPYFAVPADVWKGRRSLAAKDSLRLGLVAAREALAMAGIPEGKREEVAVIAGTTSGTALHFLSGYKACRESGIPGPDCAEYLVSNPALTMRRDLGLAGIPITLSNACVSGADAAGLGLAMIKSGRCRKVLCGGLDALSLVPHTGFARLMIYDTAPCAPFDKNRAGLNLGEAAAFLVLEHPESAQSRGQRILGMLAGYGAGSDAHHFTSPHPEGLGLEIAVRQAMHEAGVRSDELAFVNVHGTGTRENDKVEGRTLHRLLPDTPLWCTKGLTGHTLGAAGPVEAIFSLWALEEGIVPPSAGFVEEDPEIGVSPVHAPLPIHAGAALSTSLGFGGCNSALVLRRGD